MKNKWLVFLLAALFVLSVFTGCAPKAEPSPAPLPEVVPETEEPIRFDYVSVDMNGEEQSILDLCAEYDITLVNFWATWCGPCVNEMPGLASLYETQKENGIGIIGIWLDPENSADCEKVLAAAGTTYPVLQFNPAMAEQVDLSRIPVSVFLDSEGYMIGEPLISARDERQWLSEIVAHLEMIQ